MGRGDAQTQMEFSAKREMECCDWGIDDMRAADCKNWRKSPKGFFDKLESPCAEKHRAICCILDYFLGFLILFS